MREANDQIESLGAKVVAVSAKSASLARSLQETMPFPLLLDEQHALRSAFDISRLPGKALMSPTSAKNYAKALGGVRRVAVHPSEATQTPAVVVLDADQNVAWKYIGVALGDYPTIDEIVQNIPETSGA